MEEQNQQSKQSQSEPATAQSGGQQPDPQDVEENKHIAALSYVWILCLVPLLTKQDSPYAQHHAKQGLVILIASFSLMFVGWIPLLGWLIAFFGGIGLFILAITGIINALNGVMWEAPVLGEFAKKINL